MYIHKVLGVALGVELGAALGVASRVGVGRGVNVGWVGTVDKIVVTTFSGICELSKNIPDSIFLISSLSSVKVMGLEISLGTLSDGLAVKARYVLSETQRILVKRVRIRIVTMLGNLFFFIFNFSFPEMVLFRK